MRNKYKSTVVKRDKIMSVFVFIKDFWKKKNIEIFRRLHLKIKLVLHHDFPDVRLRFARNQTDGDPVSKKDQTSVIDEHF